MTKGSWRLARIRGGAQLPLIIVAVLAIALIVLGKTQPAVFDHARSYISDAMRPLLLASAGKVDNFNRSVRSAGSIFTVFEDNQRLRQENARLLKWQSTARVLQDRLKNYQKLLHAVPDPAMTKVVARVIGRSIHPFQQTLILDAGKINGIEPGEAVIDGRGMIGRIFLTGQRTSWVIPLTDSNSRIPVTIVPGNMHGIMAGDNSHMPTLETLSIGARLKAGAQVMTSGDGDLLPPGLPVGTVVFINGKPCVALFSDQNVSQDVEVVDFLHPIEQPGEASEKDLPAVAAGLQPAAPPPPKQVDTTAAPDDSDGPIPPAPYKPGDEKKSSAPGQAKSPAATPQVQGGQKPAKPAPGTPATGNSQQQNQSQGQSPGPAQ